MENQLNRKNPFTDKKTRKGPYITKKRKQQLEAYNNGQLNDQDAKDAIANLSVILFDLKG